MYYHELPNNNFQTSMSVGAPPARMAAPVMIRSTCTHVAVNLDILALIVRQVNYLILLLFDSSKTLGEN
jgi:hypothetical protein